MSVLLIYNITDYWLSFKLHVKGNCCCTDTSDFNTQKSFGAVCVDLCDVGKRNGRNGVWWEEQLEMAVREKHREEKAHRTCDGVRWVIWSMSKHILLSWTLWGRNSVSRSLMRRTYILSWFSWGTRGTTRTHWALSRENRNLRLESMGRVNDLRYEWKHCTW